MWHTRILPLLVFSISIIILKVNQNTMTMSVIGMNYEIRSNDKLDIYIYIIYVTWVETDVGSNATEYCSLMAIIFRLMNLARRNTILWWWWLHVFVLIIPSREYHTVSNSLIYELQYTVLRILSPVLENWNICGWGGRHFPWFPVVQIWDKI